MISYISWSMVICCHSPGWIINKHVQSSHQKNGLAFHYTGCLKGILIMVYHNPTITVEYFIPNKSPKQLGAFFHCSISFLCFPPRFPGGPLFLPTISRLPSRVSALSWLKGSRSCRSCMVFKGSQPWEMCIPKWYHSWLVVSTHFLVQLDHFPKDRGGSNKYFETKYLTSPTQDLLRNLGGAPEFSMDRMDFSCVTAL